MFSYNRGEWTELYVFFRVLGEGKLYSADENMNKMDNSYLQVLKVLREDVIGEKNNYIRDDDYVCIYINDELVSKIEVKKFNEQADSLFDSIKNSTGRSFSVLETENFMHTIYVKKVKDASHKADIFLELRDSHTGFTTETGFSIKSDFKTSKASLINASEATNFIYELKSINNDIMNKINSINSKNKIIERMEFIKNNNIEMVYQDTYRIQTKKNLKRIDSLFPEIIGELLKIHYLTGNSNLKECIDILTKNDPFCFDDDYSYIYKFKKLLTACSLGLDLGKKWDGLEEASGGIIIVQDDGDLITYHVYNRNLFETFLLNNVKFERGSTTKHKFATVYKENDKYYIKLNLQIRYI